MSDDPIEIGAAIGSGASLPASAEARPASDQNIGAVASSRPAPQYRITPNHAPFRRAGLEFGTRAPIIVPVENMGGAQLQLLSADPSLIVELTNDGGATWTPYRP